MTKRTVTEQQVIDAMNKYVSLQKKALFNELFEALFPELPKAGELIQVSDNCNPTVKDWYPFAGINLDGLVIVLDDDGMEEYWENYRRLTPAERGQG